VMQLQAQPADVKRWVASCDWPIPTHLVTL
jgi:hypothetical protein